MAIEVDDVLVPANVQVESIGGLRTDTAINTSDGGLEHRNAWLPITPERFMLKWGNEQPLSGPNNVVIMRNLFRTCIGPLRAFLIEDKDDNVATNVALESVTSGGVTCCQLRQAYTNTARTVYRPIYRFSTDAITVTVDDVPVTEGVDFTESDGVLTFTDEFTGPVRATVPKFYKIVRFEDDELTITRKVGDIREIQSCRVISVLFPNQIEAD